MLRTLTSEHVSHSYAEKWKARMEETYQIACRTVSQKQEQSKAQYDRKVHGAELHIGSSFLVWNLNEKEGPGKLKSFWKNQVYIVTQQKHPYSPVYELKPENGKGQLRVVHLLLPCEFLQMEK